MSGGAMLLLTLLLVLLVVPDSRQDFTLTLMHTNDVQANFEQFNSKFQPCSDEEAVDDQCFGGVSRRHTAVQQIRESQPNTLLLDAGNEFTGTAWFTEFQGNATKTFMQTLGYDAMTLGNHEFDFGLPILANFMNNLSFPVVSSNVNVSQAPELQGQIVTSHQLEVAGKTIGLVGYLTPATAYAVNPDRLSGVTFDGVLESLTAAVEDLTSYGVDIILVLGHGGYPADMTVAEVVPGVDVVIGGHSKTFLYTGTPPSVEEAAGPYPTEVSREDGSNALVVQAFAYGKYLGYLSVTFDDFGDVVSFTGNPILLDSTYEEDAGILTMVNEWGEAIMDFDKPVGMSLVYLEASRPVVRTQECNMGNLITDMLVHSYLPAVPLEEGWTEFSIALWNSGSIRKSLYEGNITTNDILAVTPFEENVAKVWLTGATLLKVLENAVSDYNPDNPNGWFLQVSGLRVAYNTTKTSRGRVVDVQVRCSSCPYPVYEALDESQVYPVLLSDYIANGGDQYTMIRDEQIQRTITADVMTELWVTYMQWRSPITIGVESRITFASLSSAAADDDDDDDDDDGHGSSSHASTQTYQLSLLHGLTLVMCYLRG